MLVPGLTPTRRRARAVRHHVWRRRRLIAAVLAAAATFSGLRAVAPPPPDTVEVLVAAHDLASGTVLTGDDLVRRDVPADLVPPGGGSSPLGRMVAGPIARGEVVTASRVVGPELARALPGQQVLPLRLPDAGMAALLRPGDEVELVATDPGTGVARVVAREVTVLATPTHVPDGPGGTAGALVVVGVADHEALAVTGAALSEFLTVTLGR